MNLLSAWLLRDQHDHGRGHGHGDDAHSHAERGHAHAHGAPGKDLNRHAAFIHVLTDALTSVAAIIALLGGKLFGWGWLDPAMGIIGALVILVWARGLLRDTAKALLDREMDDPLVGKVREALERVPDTEVTDLHLWRVGRSQYSCILSVVTHQPHTADRYKAALQPFTQLVHITAEVNRCGESAHLDSRQ